MFYRLAEQNKLRGDCFNYQRYTRTHRYRKRYPTHKKNAPTQAQVSKTIPITQEERTHASTGIENDTRHARGTHRTNTGIENDTRQ